MGHFTLDPAVLEYVRGLPTKSHAFLPYDSRSSRDQALLAYVKGAIKRNLAMVHLSDDVEADIHLVSGSGVVETAPRQVRVVPLEDAYKISTRNIGKPLEFWTNEIKKAEEAGFAGLRGSADDTMLQPQVPWPQLVEVEHMLGQVIYSRNVSALCMYDSGTLRLEPAFHDLIANHSHAIFPGLAINLRNG